jgi:hypothetical protein
LQIVDDLNFVQQRDTVSATSGPEHLPRYHWR